jgi:hypothetical protein
MAQDFGESMAIELKIADIHAKPAPGMRLEIRIEGFEFQDALAEIYSLTGSIWFEQTLLAPSIQVSSMKNQDSNLSRLQKDRWRLNIHTYALLLPDGIQAIEKKRGEGDVELRFELHYVWHQVQTSEKPELQEFVISTDEQKMYSIPRSEWIRHLGEMKWGEILLLELPTEGFQPYGELGDVSKHLGQAQECLRSHDYEGVLTQCRKSIDAASKIEDLGNGTFNKAGWKELLERRYPDDQARQSEIDEYTKSLKTLLQDGPHVLGRTPGRREAIFALSVVSSLFALLLPHSR